MTTDETQLPTLSPSRRAELVSGFQAAFAAMPDRFSLPPGGWKSAAIIPITKEAMFWLPPSTWIRWPPSRSKIPTKFASSPQVIPCAWWTCSD